MTHPFPRLRRGAAPAATAESLVVPPTAGTVSGGAASVGTVVTGPVGVGSVAAGTATAGTAVRPGAGTATAHPGPGFDLSARATAS